MPKIKPTITNPHALSVKQSLVIADMVEDAQNGKSIDPTKSHKKVYKVKNKQNASSIANQNYNKLNFRQALIDGLRDRKILGKNGKIEKRLSQGLDASINTPKGKRWDFKTILSYIQEINKITGAYAPDKSMRLGLNLNTDLTPQELDKKIRELQGELQG